MRESPNFNEEELQQENEKEAEKFSEQRPKVNNMSTVMRKRNNIKFMLRNQLYDQGDSK